MSNKPKNLIESAHQAAIEAGQADVENAYDTLFGNVEHARLPEEIFKETFLPLFAGQIKDGPNSKLTTNWIGIAGSPMLPVDIIDSKDNVLFTVPPLMSSDFVGLGSQRAGRTFNSIFKEAKEQASRVPVLGQVIIANEGSKKIKEMKPSLDNEDVKQWESIMKRYNIELPTYDSEGKVVKNKKSDGSDDLVFD